MSDLKPNSLAVKAPELRGEWSAKNLVKFEDVAFASNIDRQWVCIKCKHEWDAPPSRRTKKTPSGCPRCPRNPLSVKAPHLAQEWHPDNKERFHEVSFGSAVEYKWLCVNGHSYNMPPCRRTSNPSSGCPDCPKRVSTTNSLATKAPHLEPEWSPDNKVKFHTVAYRSNTPYKWVCAKGHVWPAPPSNRTARPPSGCPDCSGNRASELNSLATKAPWLEKEWHPDNSKKFHEVAFKSNKTYKWICPEGHVYPATAASRTHMKSGCPRCSGNQVSELNSLATKAPWLEKEWHSSNKEEFKDVSFGSGEKRKWICHKGHIWPASPSNRTGQNLSGCPRCSHRHSKAELALFEAVKERRPDTINGVSGLLRQKSLELDIYVPSLKKAIEFDGTYWHAHPEVQDRDQRKNEQCVEAGIQLLRIPEAEYEADRKGTVKKILSWLVV